MSSVKRTYNLAEAEGVLQQAPHGDILWAETSSRYCGATGRLREKCSDPARRLSTNWKNQDLGHLGAAMRGIMENMFLLLSALPFILGVLGNDFLGWVHGSSWLKSKRISLSDLIIALLALSRVVLLSSLLADDFILAFPPKACPKMIGMYFYEIMWTFINDFSIWLVTCLSVLYCLKIASFSHPAFLWLKWGVSRLVAGGLLGALLLPCASVLSLIREFRVYSDFCGIDITRNRTEYFRKKREYNVTHVLGTLWDLPPLIVSLASYLLLLLSLWRHMRRMQLNGSSPSDPSAEAHKRALRIILSFLFLFLLYFTTFLLAYSSRFLPETNMVRIIAETMAMFYPIGHTFILILGNKKLRQMLVNVMCYKPGLMSGSKGSFSR